MAKTDNKLWAGRFSGERASVADDFNSSISFDGKMYAQDIEGSLAHAEMLVECGILTEEDGKAIKNGLTDILSDLNSGNLSLDPSAEDIHTFVEAELTKRIGDAGKRLHTARSRNDQVALDLRLYVREKTGEIRRKLFTLIAALADKADENRNSVMPGYTHLQRAQPITFAHHLLCYCMMFLRDVGRLDDATRRLNVCPLGSCALAGTTYPTDRDYVAEKLGFTGGACLNSLDGVSDRDYCVELLAAYSLIMTHLSRLGEEIVLWSSWEFKFVELSDAFSTGSSIMPQKKNPDMAELIRGKTGRVYGDLMGTLTVLKGLPLAYNKDMQEDKESIFDAIDTVIKCLDVAAPMVATMKSLPANMLAACKKGFINATDLADYLTKKGMPFRTAYKTVGSIVGECVKRGITLEDVRLSEYKAYSDLFEKDLYEEIEPETCVKKRISKGSTSYESVENQLSFVRAALAENK